MRKLGIVSVVELVRLVRDGLDLEDPIQSALENARRLLLTISGSELRGARHVRAAIRQITKAIRDELCCATLAVEAAKLLRRAAKSCIGVSSRFGPRPAMMLSPGFAPQFTTAVSVCIGDPQVIHQA
jgi:hypothetical protein